MSVRSPLVLATALAACVPQAGTDCSLVGCTDEVTIHVRDADGSAVDAFRASATFPDGSHETWDCTAGKQSGGCEDAAFVVSTDAEVFDLEVTGGDGSVSWAGEVTPEYQGVYINGDECPPGCVRAEETVVLEPCADC